MGDQIGPDLSPADGINVDFEDQGSKAMSYKRAIPRDAPFPVEPMRDALLVQGLPPGVTLSREIDNWLLIFNPEMIFLVRPGANMHWAIIGGLDKRRNQGMHIHGHASDAGTPITRHIFKEAIDALPAPLYLRMHTFHVTPYPGDWCYRSNVVFTMAGHGLWGIVRVDPHGLSHDDCFEPIPWQCRIWLVPSRLLTLLVAVSVSIRACLACPVVRHSDVSDTRE